MVYSREKEICRICSEKVDPFNFEIGHDLAHSKGGKLNLQNAILLCSLCNKSMRTLSPKQARKALAFKFLEDDSKKLLKKLSMNESKFLAKNHGIKVKGTVTEGYLSSTIKTSTKSKYVNVLAKEMTAGQIETEVKKMQKPEPKKKRRKHRTDRFFF